jgi:iron-sulfur cluster repair protein YtfE (RIC family)
VIPATQPLRDEHRALLPELGALRVAADAVGSPVAGEQLDRAWRLLHRHLLPHMAAEEATLYPTIDRLVGNDATATMRRDHDEIRKRIGALDALRSSDEPDSGAQGELRAVLYGLDAIVRLHLAKEEELYYPLLDTQLSGDEAAELVTAVHEVERDLYHQATGTPAAEGPERP